MSGVSTEAEIQEFVDWKFDEWVKLRGGDLIFNFEGYEFLTLDAQHELDSAVRELLRAAFRAGAKR